MEGREWRGERGGERESENKKGMDGLRRENVSDERADGFEVLLEQNSGWNESSREGDKNEEEREKRNTKIEKERGGRKE